MGATAVLSPTKLAVQPGAEARCEVTVRNTSHVVEEMTFEILGPTAAFARVEPARLSMFPGTEGKVTVIFAPPGGSDVAAGIYDFGVKVLPKEDPEGSWVEEGELEVGSFSDSLLEVVPRTSNGRLSGRHDWALDNRGNTTQHVTMRGVHADNMLNFEFEPQAFSVAPGEARTGKLKVKPKRRFWRGAPRSTAFEIFADGADGSVLRADAMYLQEPMLPKWLLRLLLLLAALAALLAVLFFTLIKPAIKSEARNAAEEEVAPANAALEAADLMNANGDPSGKVGVDPATGAPGTTKAPGADTGGGAGGGAGGGSEKEAEEAAAELLGRGPGGKARYYKRLAPVVDPGQTGNQGDPIPEDKVLDLTDIVYQNPNGDSGILRVKKNDELLIEINLDNFRDLDYHFVTGTPVKGKEKIIVETQCRNPDAKPCTAGAYLTGTLLNSKPSPTTTAAPVTSAATGAAPSGASPASEATPTTRRSDAGDGPAAVPPVTFTTTPN